MPFEARSRYVGADYVEQLAEVRGGDVRAQPAGRRHPRLARRAATARRSTRRSVHPLIREFYEHTSRFKLSIVPEWRTWMKPVYALFKQVVAEPLGQATIPSNIEEAQRGMVSTIDTITLDGSEAIDIRGWIRTYADSGQADLRRHLHDASATRTAATSSVGFPIPSSNFTATLEPRNVDGDGLLLTSRSELPFPGHYLSAVEDGALTDAEAAGVPRADPCVSWTTAS